LLENPRQKIVQRPASAGPATSSTQIAPPRAVHFSLVSPTLARALSGVNDRQYTICIVFVHSLGLRQMRPARAFQAWREHADLARPQAGS
jgi:hypothetical protein